VAVQLGVGGARGVRLYEDSTRIVREELEKLGPLSTGQRNVFIAFGTTVTLWLLPGVLAVAGFEDAPFTRGLRQAVPETIAAMIGALMLFILPLVKPAWPA
jgi:solute carrier family 13 (sodium-dependent dicarboxylate transporter), member 2/3/5